MSITKSLTILLVSVFFPMQAQAAFSLKNDYATSTNPTSVASADFNGDGFVDMAVTNSTNDSVRVLLGDGTGLFLFESDYTTGMNPLSVASADFNGDGFDDLAVSNNGSDTVSILLRNPTGGFYPKVDYMTGRNPLSVTHADFNGDTFIDLAAVNASDNAVDILLGNGTGLFTHEAIYGTGTFPQTVASADFNNDGLPDLVTTNIDDNTVSILLRNVSGNFFDPKQDYAAGSGPNFSASADFNHDGTADLAVTNIYTNTISVLLNNGAGVFTPSAPSVVLVGMLPFAVVSADFNQDGSADLAVTVGSTDVVSVLLGDGTGAFVLDNSYPTGTRPWSVTTADFNSNGCLDLAVANTFSDTVSVFFNLKCIAPNPCVAPPQINTMVGWWTGDTVTDDISTIVPVAPGTLVGAATYAPGKVGDAFLLDGSGSYVEIPDNPKLNITTGQSLSIDAWVRWDGALNPVGAYPILEKHGGLSLWGYYLHMIDGRLELILEMSATPNPGNLIQIFTAPVNAQKIGDGQWHHVAVTMDRGALPDGKMYIDGVLVHTFLPHFEDMNNDSQLSIGHALSYVASGTWNGMIDEVEIWNSAVPESDILAIFNAGSAGKCKSSTPPCKGPSTVIYENLGVLTGLITTPFGPSAYLGPAEVALDRSTAFSSGRFAVSGTSDTIRSATIFATYANASNPTNLTSVTPPLFGSEQFSISIYNDIGGQGGGVDVIHHVASAQLSTVSRVNTGSTIDVNSLPIYQFELNLMTPISLPAGNYWVAIYRELPANPSPFNTLLWVHSDLATVTGPGDTAMTAGGTQPVDSVGNISTTVGGKLAFSLYNATCVNTPPLAVDDATSTDANTAVTLLNVMANDSDADRDTLSIVSFTQPANGTVVDNGGGSFAYTPNTGFTGDDTFTYTISDGRGGISIATVTITVNPVIVLPPCHGTTHIVALSAQAGHSLSNASASIKGNTTTGGIRFSGCNVVISYRVTSAVGGNAIVTLTFSSNLPNNFSLKKIDASGNQVGFGPIPFDPVNPPALNSWTRVGNSIIINLEDGGPYDLDGVANGVIIDPIIIIMDVVAPTFPVLPVDITGIDATSPLGATVNYALPAANDNVDVPFVSCFPASGSTFSLGKTAVTCIADDGNGNTASVGFNVTVQDSTVPVLTLPVDVSAEAVGLTTGVITGVATATDIFPVTVGNDAPAFYPLGITVITWTATDANGNTATATQTVTAMDTVAPVVTASLVPFSQGDEGEDDDDEGRFTVQFMATDGVDVSLAVTAQLIIEGYASPITVVNGQVIEFEYEDEKTEVEMEDVLEIEAPSMTFRVTATDASGNSAIVEVQPQGLAGDNDDESAESLHDD